MTNEYKTIRDVLQRFELDTSVTLHLRNRRTVVGEMLEWDWDGEIVSLIDPVGVHPRRIFEVRIDAIDMVERTT